jgi:hypothetical protein
MITEVTPTGVLTAKCATKAPVRVLSVIILGGVAKRQRHVITEIAEIPGYDAESRSEAGTTVISMITTSARTPMITEIAPTVVKRRRIDLSSDELRSLSETHRLRARRHADDH